VIGGGFWGGGHALVSALAGLVHAGLLLILFIVAAGLLLLLVRFLIVGTKAAQLYIANNSPSAPKTPNRPRTAATSPLPAPASAPPANPVGGPE
jgi:hypothetical protein